MNISSSTFQPSPRKIRTETSPLFYENSLTARVHITSICTSLVAAARVRVGGAANEYAYEMHTITPLIRREVIFMLASSRRRTQWPCRWSINPVTPWRTVERRALCAVTYFCFSSCLQCSSARLALRRNVSWSNCELSWITADTALWMMPLYAANKVWSPSPSRSGNRDSWAMISGLVRSQS